MSDAIKIFSDPSDTNKRVGINAGADPETSDALWVEGDATVNGALTANALSAPSITGGSVFLVNNGSVYIPNALHICGTHNNNNQLYFDITTDQMGGNIKLSEKTITGGFGSADRFDVVDRFSFNERSYNSSTGVRNGYYEEYRLPTVNADLTSSITYDILTTKKVYKQTFTFSYAAGTVGTRGYQMSIANTTIGGTPLIAAITGFSSSANFHPFAGIDGTTVYINAYRASTSAVTNGTITVTVLYI